MAVQLPRERYTLPDVDSDDSVAQGAGLGDQNLFIFCTRQSAIITAGLSAIESLSLNTVGSQQVVFVHAELEKSRSFFLQQLVNYPSRFCVITVMNGSMGERT